MTLALVLFLLLSVSGSLEPPPLVFHGGRSAPRAWLAAVRSALWVCWDDGGGRDAPDAACWQRVDLAPGVPDPRELRVAFLDAATALLRGTDDRVFVLVRGDPSLQPAEGALAIEPRDRLAAIECSPSGHVPIYSGGRWAWLPSPCPLPAGQCVAAPSLPALRPPVALDLFFNIEVRTEARREAAVGSEARAGASVIASVGVAFDPAGWIGRRFAWQELQSTRHPQLRELPPTRSRGSLARDEREALAAIVCGGQVP